MTQETQTGQHSAEERDDAALPWEYECPPFAPGDMVFILAGVLVLCALALGAMGLWS